MTAQKDFLLDTNILGYIADLKCGGSSIECQNLQSRIDSLPQNAKMFLCPISLGEVEYGLRIAPLNNPIDQLNLTIIFSLFEFWDINNNVAKEYYAELRTRLFNQYAPKNKKHRSKEKKRIEEWNYPTTSKELQIQENDLWIAAVAMTYNLVLVTHDKMSAIKTIAGSDLEFEDWLV